MAHECEECGQHCYCDCDDMGGLPQPADCRCLARHAAEAEVLRAEVASCFAEIRRTREEPDN